MEIIVTDVTNMGRTTACVAGWDFVDLNMVRPLSGVGRKWLKDQCHNNLFKFGNIIEVSPTSVSNNRGYPHQNEDLIVTDPPVFVRKGTKAEIQNLISQSCSSSVSDIFCNTIQNSKFIFPDTNCPSLGAINLPIDAVNISKNIWGTLRCNFNDGRDFYDFKLTGKEITDVFNEKKTAGIAELKLNKTKAYIRLGLAGSWAERNNECYIMVNHVYFY